MAPWTTYDFPPLTQPTRPTPAPYRPPKSPLGGSQPRRGGSYGWRAKSNSPRTDGGSGWMLEREKVRDEPNPFDEMAENFDGLNVVGEELQGFDEMGKNGINFDAYEDIPVEISGQDVPPPVTTFDEIDLGGGLNQNIRRCKYVKPTPIQRHAIPISMAGRDLMACAQTGSGKTAAFCFPIIAGILRHGPSPPPRGGGGGGMTFPLALILSPTRELSSQIHDESKKFAYQTAVKVVVAYGGAPINDQLRKLERGVDILVATPGRLVDMIERGRISLRMVRYLALDEADRMLDMGFEPQIRKIVQQSDMPLAGARQTMLFSATFPTEIQKLASDFLSNYIFLSVGRVGSSTDLIAQKVELVDERDKRKYLKDLLVSEKRKGANGKHALTIVFVETKRGVDQLAYWLCLNGFPATAIHGDKVQMERERALKSFKKGETPIMVATDVAARGLDIPRVAHVINFDLPRGIDDYVHRIGRTGRAGKTGIATAFFNDKNHPIAKALVELMEEANQEVPSWLAKYAETSSTYGYGNSRRSRGGAYFGGRDYRGFDYAADYSSPYGGDYAANYSSPHGGDYATVPSTEPFVSASSSSAGVAAADPYTSPAYGYTHGYGSVVATGWD